MRNEHERLRHCPPEQLLHSIRQKYWPISGCREAQKTVRKCLKCYCFRPTTPEVVMGDLPKARVQRYARPFSVTGIYYAGPIQLRESKRRGRIFITKVYVAVFICFSIKAVHLELVTDLTTESFLAALRRFTARRGLCTQLYSDNGTNFVGASRELEEIYTFLVKAESKITEDLADRCINWNFIPPRSPHFGGLWEAAVRIMKRHLCTVTQGKAFTYEEYHTLLTEIESILNSRPLTPLTNDLSDLRVITPARFLIGDSLTHPIENDLLKTTDNRLSHWQHLQKMRQQLWNRWHREYLQELQKTTKWCAPGTPINPNTLVLLREDNLSPLQWPLGRMIDTRTGWTRTNRYGQDSKRNIQASS